MSDDREAIDKRRSRRDLATLVALCGLLVTLGFNTYGVFSSRDAARAQADAAERTSLESQIGTLTSISSYLQQVDVGLDTARVFEACADGSSLSSRGEERVVAALTSYEYLAWLFRQPSWKLEDANRYWRRKMMRLFDLALQRLDPDAITRDFTELARYKQADNPDLEYLCKQAPLTP